MKTALKTLIIVLMVILVVSCPLLQRDYSSQDLGDDVEIPDDGLGTLTIVFGAETPAIKTLVPLPEELNIARYEIEGMLEGGDESFIASVGFGETLIQSGLTPGSWTISVDAIDPEEITIGHGETTVEIVAGASTAVRIVISPLGGSGTLDITIRWNKHLFDLEEIIATVSPDIAGSSSLDFEPIDKDGNYHFGNCLESGVPAGYYLITMQLFGDGQRVWGTAEAVIIFAGSTTSHTYTYTSN
jgi:hypothetical protein